MTATQIVMLAFQTSILCTVFGFGLKATPDDLLYVVRHPGLLARSIASMLLAMPVLAIAAVYLFDLRHSTAVVLVALSISPVPPLLPQRQAKGGGERSYGLGLMAWCALLAIGVVPLWMKVLGLVSGRAFVVDFRDIARVLLIAAIAPLLTGMAIRALSPVVADRLARPVIVFASILLPLAVLALLAGSWRAVWAATGDGTILALAGFVVAGLLIGEWLGRPNADHAVVLALSTACRHPAIALTIASANFPEERFGGTILLYLIVNVALGIPYLAWHRRHASPA
jgi:bile acid:Na+ symporter, BASS family